MSEKANPEVTMPSTKRKAAQILAAIDPDNVPTRVVDGIDSSGLIGGHACVNLVSKRFGLGTDGEVIEQLVVEARLRFSIKTATLLRDQLDVMIAEALSRAKKQRLQ
jgi:hypothetical protein